MPSESKYPATERQRVLGPASRVSAAESRYPATEAQRVGMYPADGGAAVLVDHDPAISVTPAPAYPRPSEWADDQPANGVDAGKPDTDRGVRADSTADGPVLGGATTGAGRPDTRPEVGSVFLGFRLLEEIGRGAFSRVYLAEQGDVADRQVVVKVTTDSRRETHALARLQHANIVPVHSVHRGSGFHVVCMPYLGPTTLVNVYRELDGMPTLPISGRDLFTTLNTRRAPTGYPALPTEAAAQPPAPMPALATLAGRSYVDAVLWLAARLADGLDHAHARGVIHRDLKPANILLADDGQPMLLDFNLATSEQTAADQERGGTPLYMSPEQLEAFVGSPRPADARSDLYSLGVVLFELLTRQSPFPRHKSAGPEALRAMIAERSQSPPRLRGWNRAVSPAVESIVRHCLEPDPAGRYQSARELKDDIERHLADQPLRHAVEPSVRERVRKWRRRNRSLASPIALLAAVAAAAVVAAAGYSYWGLRLARLEAAATFRAFSADAQAAQVLLLDRNADRSRLDDGVRACETALARFQVLGRPDWLAGRPALDLPDPDRDRLREQVGEVLYLLGKATTRQATLDAGRTDPQPALHRAFEMTDTALACYPDQGQPRAVWEHRAELARLLGRPAEARQMAKQAADRPVESAADRFLLAHQYTTQGECRKALPLLSDLTRDDPRHFVAWFVQGVCHLELLQDGAAVGCFNSCVALRPDYHWAWYNRGLAARRQRNFAQARADFDRVVALRPDFALGHLNRGLARHELKDHVGAVEDLTRALELNGPATSILFRRAAANRAAGNAAAADRDLADALRREPTDEDGFIDRGLARVNRDATAALADFDAALRLNPQSYRGLQNKAAVLADKFHRDADSLAVLDETVRLYPDSVLARGGRGVLLARAGHADRAVADAKAATAIDAGPATLYQVACIYALVSAAQPSYRPKALQLLSAALKQGYGHDLLERDPDLAPLHGQAEFQSLAGASRSLRTGGG